MSVDRARHGITHVKRDEMLTLVDAVGITSLGALVR